MRNSQSVKKIENRHFLSQKNLAMNRLISEIDSPEDDVISSNATPTLLQYPSQFPQQQSTQQDSLTTLITKAQEIVKTNSHKIDRDMQKRRARVQEAARQQNQAFMTGVGIHEVEQKEREQDDPTQVLDEEVMKLLQRKTLDDQLEQLKKQIKLTNVQLKSYERQVKGTEKNVHHLAGRYNSYFNLKIPVKASTVDFSGLSYFELKNFKKYVQKEQ